MSKNNQSFFEALTGTFSISIVVFWFFVLVTSVVLFILKIPVGRFNLLASVVLTISFLLWHSFKISKDALYVGFLVIFSSALLVLAAVFVSGKIIDVSYDGQAYHEEAIIQLSRGWNPVYMQLDGQATGNLERWLNHYPKAIWYFAAGVYEWTGNIESGKALSILAPISAFTAFLWALWRVKVNRLYKVLVSLILSASPVALYQSLSYYVDGVLVSCLLIAAALAIREAVTKEKSTLWPFVMVLVCLFNIKLSAVVFGLILVSGVIFYFWTSDKLRLALLNVKAAIFAVIIGILIIGYNPYVTNFVVRGNPLYPSMGKGAYDYVAGNVPENYWKYPAPVRLFQSIFAKTSLVRGKGQFAESKIPFNVSQKELDALRETNAKTGGFGPFFGGIFLLSAIITLFYIIFSNSKDNRKYVFLGFCLMVLGSASLVATSSVARYVPYVWFIPEALALCLFLNKSAISKIVGIGLSILLLINNVIIAYAYFPYNIKASEKYKEELYNLSEKLGDEAIVIDVMQFGSTKIKLKDYGIRYQEVPPGTECKKRIRILSHSIAEECMF